MKVYLDSIGCRLNQAEIESYAHQFRQAGHTLVEKPELADLAVINTCAVTAAAAADSRQKVRWVSRAAESAKAAWDNEMGFTIVTGCWSTLRPREALGLPGVRQVVPNSVKDRLVPDLLGLDWKEFDPQLQERQPVPGLRSRTRAFIKVQDGCDNRCAFCVAALARGKGRSRLPDEILRDVCSATCREDEHASGAVKEVVLSGVHLGSWGRDLSPQQHLGDLVGFLLNETDLPRLRLSSLEPWDMDEDFLGIWQNERLCRHLHLPLQSGCVATLRRMQRKTSPEAFARLVDAARLLIPGVAVTTDVIVGFPGETEEEFNQSLEFVKQMNFAGGHVFSYSRRQGTAASRMSDQVPPQVRKQRSAIMRAALEESAQAFKTGFLDQELPVLWESAISLGPGNWEMSGLTDNYLRVHATSQLELHNQITPVRLSGLNEGFLTGEIIIKE